MDASEFDGFPFFLDDVSSTIGFISMIGKSVWRLYEFFFISLVYLGDKVSFDTERLSFFFSFSFLKISMVN